MRNISFRRTVGLRLIALVAPVAMLAACGQNDAATDEAAKPADTATEAAAGAKTGPTPAATPIAPAGTAELSKVKQEFVNGLTKSCTAAAVRTGAPAGVAGDICRCTGEELARTKSEAELLTMSPSDAEPVMKACAQKAGLTV